MRSFLYAVLVLSAFAVGARADSVSLASEADTTLIELVPDNNMGGQNFFNAGTTLNGSRNRGLLRFSVHQSIPAGSKIKSVQLLLEVVGIPIDEPAGANFRLHRLLRPWGEGDKISIVGPGRGDTATPDEATWNDRFALTTNSWGAPGGLAGTDFVSVASGEQFIEIEELPYTFDSAVMGSAGMVADVQLWLDEPVSNHGWLLKAEDELVRTTARRFASSEDLEYGPQLSVEFEPPPLLVVNRTGSDLRISFVTRTNESYVLQTAGSITASWSSISNIAAGAESRTVELTNSISGSTGFFRLLLEP